MMKKTLVSAALAASLFALSVPASATLTNWYVDTDGAGGNPAVLVQDYLDLVGTAYVHNTLASGGAFSFNEVGRFVTATADGGSLSGGTNLLTSLNSYFVGTGTGTSGPTGTLNFASGGTLKVFSGATDIADFTLQVGSANLIANSTLPNGTVSLIFKATGMQSGYFFDTAMNDLAIQANSPTGVVLGFATTNAISLATTDPATGFVNSGLITDYNTAFSPAVTAPLKANNTTDLYLSNNGQFRMSVPEPSILSLFGLALVGFGFASRRKSNS